MDLKWNKNFSLMLVIVAIQVANVEDNLSVNAFAKQLVVNGNVVRTKTADQLIKCRHTLFFIKSRDPWNGSSHTP